MKIRTKISGIRAIRSQKKHAAQEESMHYKEWWQVIRKILPPTIRERNNWLEMTDGTYMKCVVVGVPKHNKPGYSRTISPRLLGDLLNTSQVNCHIGYTYVIKAFSQEASNRAMQDVEMRNLADMVHDMSTNQLGKIKNKTGFIADDIKSDQQKVHNQDVTQAYTSCIIIIKANSLPELDIAYSHVQTVLRNNLVGFYPADSNMLSVYKSAQPWGVRDDSTWVDCISTQIAAMLPFKRIDSRTGSTGIWFGNQKMLNPVDTGVPIMVDLSKLSAEHGLIFGPTGSGKTFLELVVFMMRAHDQGYTDKHGNHKKYRVIYFTDKADSTTQFRNVPRFYKEDGIVIDVGDKEESKDKVSVNPLQIVFDESIHTRTAKNWLNIYHRHKLIVASFFDSFFEEGLSDSQRSYLDITLNKIYNDSGIITVHPNKIVCNHEKWTDGANFPTIHLLRKIWKDDMDSRGLKRLRESAQSLHNRTNNFDNIGSYGYMNECTTIDLSKDVIVIDLSGLDAHLQNAMSAFIIGIIGARFNTDAEQKTMFVIDEGVSFTENPERLKLISDTYMKGRSQNVTGVICFTQPTDMTKEFGAMLKTNSMWAYVLGKGLTPASVKYVEEFFELSKEAINELSSSSRGEGLLLLNGQEIPIHLEVTDQELSVLQGTDKEPENHEQSEVFMVVESVSDMVLEQGFCLDEWIENPTTKMMADMGYEAHSINRVVTAGKAKAWIKSDIIEVDKETNRKKVHNQTLEHFGSVMQIAGYLMQQGFSDVRITHFDEEDVSATLGDKKFAFEYEHPRSHTQEQLVKKRLNLETMNKRCFFVCPGDTAKFVARAVGAHNTYTRGSVLKTAIDAVLEEYNSEKHNTNGDEQQDDG